MKRELKPHKLLDALIAEHQLSNDAALGRFLGIAKPIISKIRNKKLPVTAERILQIHDVTGWDVKHIKDLLRVA